MLSERPDVAGGNDSAGPDPNFLRQERAPGGAGLTLGSLQPGGTQATEPGGQRARRAQPQATETAECSGRLWKCSGQTGAF